MEICIHETSQVLLAGVPGGFSRGSSVFAPPTDWSVSYELNNLERDVKLNKKCIHDQVNKPLWGK